MKKSVLLCGLLLAIILLFGCTNSNELYPSGQNQLAQDTLIKNTPLFFPSPSELSTEWKINQMNESCETGTAQYKSQVFVKGSGYETEKVTIILRLFVDTDKASDFYSTKINEVKDSRDYSNLSQTNNNCFGWQISSMADVQKSYCLKKNMVTYVSASALTLSWTDYTNNFNKIILQKNPASAYDSNVLLEEANCENQTNAQDLETEQELPALNWSGFDWNQIQENGVKNELANEILTIQGKATQSYWNNFGQITKPFNANSTQVEISLTNLQASASGASIKLIKNEKNSLTVEKHRDTDQEYNTAVFVIEKVNGVDSFKFISTETPTENFDTYKIKKISNGYEVYFNNELVYLGTLDLTDYKKAELIGVARATGDQIEAQFRNYSEE
jgi:hypothetical protein